VSPQLTLNITITPEALIALFSLFPSINAKLDKIMTTQAETAAQISGLLTVVDKIGVEIDASLAEIQALKDLITNAGNTDPAVTAALDALTARLTALDLKVPDAPA
jgi:hypothetical protein